ncbi:MAG: hypothetical protein PVH25_02060 [Burkholderiales bacterium]|jgi:uncharacterized low-complexity protein
MATKKNALSLAIGTAFAASIAAVPVANAANNPFHMDSLKSGYQISGVLKGEEAKCGEDKDDKGGEAKCGESKCGGDS